MRATFCAAVFVFGCLGATAGRAQNDAANETNSFEVTENFQLQAPVAAGATVEDMTRAIEVFQKSLGELADKQCGLLAETFNGTCAVVQLNLSSNIDGRQRFINRDFGGAQRRVWSNMSATFTITPPAPPAPSNP
jgi:hypothetical protein